MHQINKLAYSIDELCRASAIGRTLVYAEISAGRLRPVKVGARTIILREEAERWLRDLGQPSKGSE